MGRGDCGSLGHGASGRWGSVLPGATHELYWFDTDFVPVWFTHPAGRFFVSVAHLDGWNRQLLVPGEARCIAS